MNTFNIKLSIIIKYLTCQEEVPNYQNELLLNIIEGILPSGPEQWKIVAQNYQQAAKEDDVRYYDDVRRHFIDKLCKKLQRQTGLNNKSGSSKSSTNQSQDFS